MKVVVLASGGYDSALLLSLYKDLNYEVYPLFINYGQKSEEFERSALYRQVVLLGIGTHNITVADIKLPWVTGGIMSGEGNFYVEMRNMIFVSCAVSYAESIGANEVAFGAIGVGDYPDANVSFLQNMDTVAMEARGISVRAPLINMDKNQVVELGNKLNVDKMKTFSCFNPKDGKPCDVCPSCIDLNNAIKFNGGTK